jgi:hypothetical protein
VTNAAITMILSEWQPGSYREAGFYRFTRGGRKQFQAESRGWEQTKNAGTTRYVVCHRSVRRKRFAMR